MSEQKIYNFENRYGKKYQIRFHRAKYEADQSLAVVMENAEGDVWLPYATLTVFVAPLYTRDRACVDTNNLGVGIVAWLEDNDIAKTTGQTLTSGFCTYPVMEFNEKFLEETPEIV